MLLLTLLACAAQAACDRMEDRWVAKVESCLQAQGVARPADLAMPTCDPDSNLDKRACELECVEAASCGELVFWGVPPTGEPYADCVQGCQ